MLFFFFYFAKRGKNTSCVFFFMQCSSVIHSDFEEVRFFFRQNLVVFFFLPNFCVFFFSWKSAHVINSLDFLRPEKKTPRHKKNSFFIHSFDLPQGTKTNNSRGKNTIPLVVPIGFLKPTKFVHNIVENSMDRL